MEYQARVRLLISIWYGALRIVANELNGAKRSWDARSDNGSKLVASQLQESQIFTARDVEVEPMLEQ